MIRKKELILFVIILIVCALILTARNRYMHSGQPYDRIRITVSGETLGIYDLSADLVIPIGDTNICTIIDGRASMTMAECPDQICVQMAAIDGNGGQIVCLPNEVVIEGLRSESADEDNNDPMIPDIIAS